jgi:hypothetical protein
MESDGKHFPIQDFGGFHSALRKLYSAQNKGILGKCMYWAENCSQPPTGSHSIARSWLERIADKTNHVIMFEIPVENAGKKPISVTPTRIGINEATKFPGFCPTHDSKVFSCLENINFTGSQQQLWCLAYRSICREACKKHQVVSFQHEIGMVKDVPTEHGIRTVIEKCRCVHLLTKKQALEDMILASKFALAGYVIELAQSPTVLVSATYFPRVTFTGRKLDDRDDWLTLTIMPNKSGGAVVFTWDKQHSKNVSLLIKSLRSIPPHLQTTCLLDLIFEVSENFAISPFWWDSLSSVDQTDTLRRFGHNTTMDKISVPQNLHLRKKVLTDWQPVKWSFVG